ncbi:hypothetical protein GQ607_002389 [Colletotrichum asianum]|uniref:Uncharacterized protein n=1 Tax=Colletotrichum asianum TaxID=702518 RepID=A0A8H3WQI8_9PEZI|nr:hypothetical protein GQ607_002389 [Colletotrichum asianum]
MTNWDVHLVGIVTLPVACLRFPPPNEAAYLGRLEDKRIALRLAQRFDREGINCHESANQIRGIIDSTTYHGITERLGISKEMLRRTAFERKFPLVSGSFVVHCVNGRHRAEAARLLCGDQATWTIRLHHFPQDTPEKLDLIHREPKEHANKTVFSDGEICRNTILHFDHERYTLSREWENILSESKRKCLVALFGNSEIIRVVRVLTPFPGLWEGFQLGNWLKHLATRCDEMIVMYWRHIFHVWNSIVGDRQDLAQLVDVETVRHLQFRAPGGSSLDRNEIMKLMADRSLFRHVSSTSDRDLILHNILSVTTVIPSVEAFHRNMLYISLGARILKAYLLPRQDQRTKGRLQTETSAEAQFSGVAIERDTLFKDLMACFKIDQRSVLQVTETSFRPCRQQASPHIAYVQLFIAALRNFASLCSENPLRDFRDEDACILMSERDARRLRWQAWNLGFRNAATNEASKLAPTKERQPRCSGLSEWRGGKPYLKTFFELRKRAFLYLLCQERDQDIPARLSPDFVFRDLVEAFFGNNVTKLGLDLDQAQEDMPMVDELPSEFESDIEMHSVNSGVPARQREPHRRANNATRKVAQNRGPRSAWQPLSPSGQRKKRGENQIKRRGKQSAAQKSIRSVAQYLDQLTNAESHQRDPGIDDADAIDHHLAEAQSTRPNPAIALIDREMQDNDEADREREVPELMMQKGNKPLRKRAARQQREKERLDNMLKASRKKRRSYLSKARLARLAKAQATTGISERGEPLDQTLEEQDASVREKPAGEEWAEGQEALEDPKPYDPRPPLAEAAQAASGKPAASSSTSPSGPDRSEQPLNEARPEISMPQDPSTKDDVIWNWPTRKRKVPGNRVEEPMRTYWPKVKQLKKTGVPIADSLRLENSAANFFESSATQNSGDEITDTRRKRLAGESLATERRVIPFESVPLTPPPPPEVATRRISLAIESDNESARSI